MEPKHKNDVVVAFRRRLPSAYDDREAEYAEHFRQMAEMFKAMQAEKEKARQG